MIAAAVARSHAYFVNVKLQQTCRICRNDEAARASWGCEEPAADYQLEIPCPACAGENPECPECGGTDRIRIFRCPRALLDQASAEAVELHAMWPEGLPFAGGVYDQPAQYFHAMRVLDRAFRLLDEAENPELKRDA